MPSQWSCRPGCLSVNDSRRRKCAACGKPRAKRRRPQHLAALKLPYEAFVQANDGIDACWICEQLGVRMAGRLQRDHWHAGPHAGSPRGVLCPFHNRKLGAVYTPELVAAMLAYLCRFEAA